MRSVEWTRAVEEVEGSTSDIFRIENNESNMVVIGNIQEIYFTPLDILFGLKKFKEILKPFRNKIKIYSNYIPLFYQGTELKIDKPVLRKVDNFCRDRDVDSFCFMYRKEDKIESNILKEHNYHKIKIFPTTYLKMEFQSIDEYLNMFFKKKQKENIRKEIRESKNIEFTAGRLDKETLPKIVRYSKENQKKYGKFYSNGFTNENYFINMDKYCRDSYFFIYAFNKDELIGFSSFFLDNGIIYGDKCGYDENLNKRYSLFFNLVFYEPIKYAINNKIRYIYAGPGNYQAKTRRGFKKEYLYCYYKFYKKQALFFPVYLIMSVAYNHFLKNIHKTEDTFSYKNNNL